MKRSRAAAVAVCIVAGAIAAVWGANFPTRVVVAFAPGTEPQVREKARVALGGDLVSATQQDIEVWTVSAWRAASMQTGPGAPDPGIVSISEDAGPIVLRLLAPDARSETGLSEENNRKLERLRDEFGAQAVRLARLEGRKAAIGRLSDWIADSGTLSLELPSGRVLVLAQRGIQSLPGDAGVLWEGDADNRTSAAALVLDGVGLTATVDDQKGSVYVRPFSAAGDNTHIVIDTSASPQVRSDASPKSSEPSNSQTKAVGPPRPEFRSRVDLVDCDGAAAVDTESWPEIDVLFVATNETFAATESLAATLSAATARANSYFEKSNAGVRLKDLGAVQLDTSGATDLAILEELKLRFAQNDASLLSGTGPSWLMELSQLRNAKRADVVVLVVSALLSDIAACGDSARIPATRDTALAVVEASEICLSNWKTLPHELGHLLGARHQLWRDSAEPFEAHALVRGRNSNRRTGTMMADRRDIQRLIPLFTNPEIACENFRIGHRVFASEVDTIARTAAQVAAFGDRSSGTQRVDRDPRCEPLGFVPTQPGTCVSEEATIGFAPRSLVLERDLDRARLESMLSRIRSDKDIATVRISGHTDDVGDPDENLRLSYRRAKVVADAIANARPPGAKRQPVVCAYGEDRPICEVNELSQSAAQREEARRLNRRVQIELW